MNSILFTGEEEILTDEDYKVIEEAEEIIKDNDPDFKPHFKKKHIGLLTVSIIFFVFFIFLGSFSTIFALVNYSNENIMQGVSVLGVDLSNLSKDDAKKKIEDEAQKRITTELILNHNDEVYTLHLAEISADFDIDKAINDAYSIGRNGNIFKNNYQILNCLIHRKNIDISFSFNADNLISAISQINGSMADGLKQPNYEIDGNNLIVHVGKDGYITDIDKFKSLLLDKVCSISYNTDSLQIPTVFENCSDIDIDKIHTEVYKEAKDAYFTTEPLAVFPSSTGLDFAISVDEAKALITGESDNYTIPLKTLYPNVKTSDIGMEAFPNKLSSYTSSYATSNSNRCTNISLASSKINGLVLMPGEVFSFNDTVGKRTPQAGFKVAGVYVAGQVTSDYGGGICQVSSTLYNAVLRANLEIVERTNHQFDVGYVPIGTDATVSWGAPDFKFKNSRSYPIKISISNYNKRITVTINGLRESNEYDVEIVSYRTGTINYKTTYTTDKSLAKGQTKVIQSGSNGATSVAYRILKQNGVEVSRELLSRDTYSPHNQIIARGN